jgi:hypothetical protein
MIFGPENGRFSGVFLAPDLLFADAKSATVLRHSGDSPTHK